MITSPNLFVSFSYFPQGYMYVLVSVIRFRYQQVYVCLTRPNKESALLRNLTDTYIHPHMNLSTRVASEDQHPRGVPPREFSLVGGG